MNTRLRMKVLRALGTLSFLCMPLLLLAQTGGGLIEWPIDQGGNGHFYGLTPAGCFTAVEAFATSQGGHLVTIDDASENEFIRSTFLTGSGYSEDFWIGLHSPAGDWTDPATWTWISGSPSTYRNWRVYQPDWGVNDGEDDRYAVINYLHRGDNTWDNYPNCNWAQPRGIYEVATGSIGGTVRIQGSGGLPNVLIKLLAAGNVNPVVEKYTNLQGEYSFGGLLAGDYEIMIVEPMGYSVGQNPQSGSVTPGGLTVVDFTLMPASLSNSARGIGYWKHQFDVYVKGRGTAQETEQDLYAYICRVEQYYTPHFNTFAGSEDLEDWQAILTANRSGSMLDRARQHLAALVLNLVSYKMTQLAVISADEKTAGDALTFASSIVTSDPPPPGAELDLAKNVAEKVNNKEIIDAGIIEAGGILFKQGAIAWKFSLPEEFALLQNYPNPFNPTTKIRYDLPQPSHVTLKVYDVTGREVVELINETREAGYHEATFDASSLASGMYIYRLTAGAFTAVRKLVLLK